LDWSWSENKNKSNFSKHGVWFEEAKSVWADVYSVEFFDPEHSVYEDRFIRVGHSSIGRLILIVFSETSTSEVIRIISARRATLKERQVYEEGI